MVDANTPVCVWSERDCVSEESMRYSNERPGTIATRPACRCDAVRTGACINKKDPLKRYCAVQNDACNGGRETFVNWRDLAVATGPNLICRLCAKLPNLPPPVQPPNLPPPVQPPTTNPDLASPPVSSPALNTSGLSSRSTVSIIVGAGGAAVLLALLMKFVLVRVKSKARGSGKNGESSQETPVASNSGGIAVGQPTREDVGLREDALRRSGFGGGGQAADISP